MTTAYIIILHIIGVVFLIKYAIDGATIVDALPALLRATSSQLPNGYQLLFDQLRVRTMLYRDYSLPVDRVRRRKEFAKYPAFFAFFLTILVFIRFLTFLYLK